MALLLHMPHGPLPAQAEMSIVVIEEVAWAGSSLSTADEWIELANLGDATATVGGWSVRGMGGTIFLPDDAVIPPHGTFIVANYPETDEKAALNVAVSLATTTVSLSNSALAFELVDANGVTVDRAGDGNAPPAGSSSPKATMVRVSADAWMSATSSIGFDDGIADFGTPGTCDLCVIEETLPEPVVEIVDEIVATTTEEIVVETTTTTELLVEVTTTTETVVTIAEPDPDPSPVPGSQFPVPVPPLIYALSEAMSHPASGPEWVELAVDDLNATSTDRALELWDAVGRIATVAEGTPVTAPGYLVVTLTSARLNNGGDRLEVRETSQTIIDATTIPELEDGVAWAYRPGTGDWSETNTATPGAANIVPTIVTVQAPPPVATQPVLTPAPTPTTAPTPVPAPTVTVTKVASKPTVTKPPTSKKTVSAPKSATTTTSPTKASATKQTATKGSPALTPLSFTSMFDNTQDEARVRVTGTVGSVERLLGATHAFILLGEDGRGIIVYLPKHLHVPPLGTTVRVMGTLASTYKGPELRMKTTDVWTTVASLPAPRIRSVELLAPGEEDSWSLVAATGTVRDVKARGFVIDVDGLDVQTNIPPAVKFRAERLVKGDVVRVTGLLDLRKDAPALLPRTADEVEIVKHAPSSITSASEDHASRFPDWTPFGAAGGAIALTGAAKHLHALLRRRRLEALAAKLDVAA
ncbi:hypothetical protein A3E39_04560 [Candidatus Uhrbacteria bacterium RIFCSPHIGHO2_12_FULL_60_25]|uniref:LTD domain-containing protein n=1 Tax=Candidatus Uhrbacteria bacterium RIFCSPHIGHO2_12_FULL_60_25 TaxID=1802399 RepID=A0A1F7UM87_9BACT|nr:MAG: hypothetical protein A3D73_04215 [Candidatus Uhrbacteria bacterium RIFCSPHIGHO2_02_FULL_60_44]OGL79401.1 MAG: hypothetical protein A3E39_04560 [Candidatus Uhrbacteria bacterium RIFCSPHIGHO2_12_FULL_60_25]